MYIFVHTSYSLLEKLLLREDMPLTRLVPEPSSFPNCAVGPMSFLNQGSQFYHPGFYYLNFFEQDPGNMFARKVTKVKL